MDQLRTSFITFTDVGNYTIKRDSVYEDVISIYNDGKILTQYHLTITYDSEMALDDGGVTRDMFSGFWEEAYKFLFEGQSLLIPLIQGEMEIITTIGKVLSHGYLASGHMPVRISLPTLLQSLLGPGVDIPKPILIAAFMDYVSSIERDVVRNALGCTTFGQKMTTDLVCMLSRFGCCQIPSPDNLSQAIIDAAKYEFLRKPSAASVLMYFGIPNDQKEFWKKMGLTGIIELYSLLSVTQQKVISSFECNCSNAIEEKVFFYLTAMVGNLVMDDLRSFLRFTTGSSVLL